MAENFVALLLVELLYEVYSVVGVKVVYLLGDFLYGHGVEELETVVFVEFHEHVGRLLLVEKLEEIFGFLEVEVAV